MSDLVCLGEALIDFVAMESGVGVGEASGFLKAPGGAPANVAVGAAKLGISSAFLGKVGDDPFGHFLADTFFEAGSNIDGMVFSKEYRTGLAFVSLKHGGERDFCFFRNPSADMTYSLEELDIDRIRNAKVFHFGSITLIDEPAGATTRAAVELARESGILISYDPNLRPSLWQDMETAQKTILSMAPKADIIKVSEEELLFLSSSSDSSGALNSIESISTLSKAFMEKYDQVSLFIVTRGAEGCYWRTKSGLAGSLPGINVQAVDTTGAGDGFVAALLGGLIANGKQAPSELKNITWEEFEHLFQVANIVGAITTTRKGAIPGLPTISELNELGYHLEF